MQCQRYVHVIYSFSLLLRQMADGPFLPSSTYIYPDLDTFDRNYDIPTVLEKISEYRAKTTYKTVGLATLDFLYSMVLLNRQSKDYSIGLKSIISLTGGAGVCEVFQDQPKYDLKGQCHGIFCLRFFYHRTSHCPNRHAQKQFRICSNIRGVICICNQLLGDEYTGELTRISLS
jgi:hypothetical protein